MKQWGLKTRDLVLVAILLVLAGGTFLVFKFVIYHNDSSYAHMYYGSSDIPIAEINFDSGDVVINYYQENPEQYTKIYPIVEEGTNEQGHAVIWVTVLGDYEVNDLRQEVVVEFDLDRKSIETIAEESPNNICSRQGVSTSVPLICLPNRVRVEFVSSDDAEYDYLS